MINKELINKASGINKRSSIESSICERARRKGSKVSLQRMRYANNLLYEATANSKMEKVLFVGIGHGHDAILALIDDIVANAVGVDPYISSHGNDAGDMHSLLNLIETYKLSNRFTLVRSTVEDYLNESEKHFDAVICGDVLHHIFESSELLGHSQMFYSAVGLFERFFQTTNEHGQLLISDVHRYGLRPFLHNHVILHGKVNYKTKQPWKEWTKAAQQAGWRLQKLKTYIPYTLRGQAWLWSGAIGRYTVSDRYQLSFVKGVCK